MADVVRTVGSVTGDSATIADALTWLASNYNRATDDVAVIRLVDDEEYLANTVSLSLAGTPTATSYIRLEAGPGVECLGRDQGARIINASGADAALRLAEDFVHVKGVSIKVTSSSSSREGIRVLSGVGDVLVEKCYIETNNVGSQDGIYTGNYACGPITIFDCVIVQGGANARGGIHAQQFSSTALVQTWHIEHCTINANGAQAGVGIRGAATTANVYNSCSFNSAGGIFSEDFEETMGGVEGVYSGAGNISSDGSAAAKFGVLSENYQADLRDVDSAGNQFLVVDASADFQLLEPTLGTDRAIDAAQLGGVRDSRLDLTVDVAGNPRPATYTDRDRGAFEVVSAPAGTSASGAVTLPGIAVAAIAGRQPSASGAIVAPAAAVTGSAAATRQALASFSVSAPGVAGATTSTRSASGNLGLSSLLLSSAVGRETSAAGAASLPGLVLSAAASSVRAAQGALAIGGIEISAGAGVQRLASAAFDVSALLLSAQAVLQRSASAAVELAGLAVDGNIGRSGAVAASIALTPLELAAAADRLVTAGASFEVPALELFGVSSVTRQAEGALTLSSLGLSALAGNETQASASFQFAPVDLAAVALVDRGAAAALGLPVPELAAEARLELRAVAALSMVLVDLVSSVITPAVAGEFLRVLVRLTSELQVDADLGSELGGDAGLNSGDD